MFKTKEETPQQEEVQPPPVATPQRKRRVPDESVKPEGSTGNLPDSKKIKPSSPGPTTLVPAAAPSGIQPPQSGETTNGTSGNGDVGEKPPNNPKPKFIPGGLTRRQAWGFSQYMF